MMDLEKAKELGKGAVKAAKEFQPIGLEKTMKKVIRWAVIGGAVWLAVKALGNFFLVWKVCNAVTTIAKLFIQ